MQDVINAARQLNCSVVAAVPLEAYSSNYLVLFERCEQPGGQMVWRVFTIERAGEDELALLFAFKSAWKHERLNNALTTFIVQANLKVKIGPRIEEKF